MPDMTSANVDRDIRLNELADEFADRYRRGERPALSEYIAKHPELANDIRGFFPALIEVESIKDAFADAVVEPVVPSLGEFGDFRLVREIGRGGMGIVYEAEQISLRRRVALKILTQRMLRDDVQKRRFEREARATARLHHTNIVPEFGTGEHDRTPYYVMQFIPGLGLDLVAHEVARMGCPVPDDAFPRPVSAVTNALLFGQFSAGDRQDIEDSSPNRPLVDASEVTMSMTQPNPSSAISEKPNRRLTYYQGVARIGIQVADALEYAHRQGILHRDVKPSNLLLDLAGTTWVTDFGLAKVTEQDDLTRTGDLVGTLRYMPPEAFDGQFDVRGDVYGVGITLYEMLAHRPAYDERDRAKLVKTVTTVEPTRLSRLQPHVPRDLDIIIHKAMDREPARRYQSAAELSADLQRFLNDEPIRARKASPVEQMWRWCRHNSALASISALSMLLLLAIAAGGIIAASIYRHQRDDSIAAREEARQRLRDSKLTEARALRVGKQMGRRFDALQSLAAAAQIRPGDDLRDEACAALAACDMALENVGRVLNCEQCVLDSTGQRYAHWLDDGTILATRVADGQITATLPGPGCRPFMIDWCRNGQYLAAKYHRPGSEKDNVAIVWNVAEQREVFRAPGPIEGFAFGNPDQFAVTLLDRRAIVFALPSGTVRWEKTISSPGRVTFDPLGRRLVCAPLWTGPLQLYSLHTDDVTELPQPASVRGMDFSPDGRLLAAAGSDKRIYVWDLQSGAIRYFVGHNSKVTQVTFSSTGDLLASTGWDGRVILWQPHTGEMLLDVSGFQAQLRFTCDDQYLGVGGIGGQLQRIRVAAGRECRKIPFDPTGHNRLWGIDITPDGRLVALASDEGVRFYDLDAAQFVGGLLPTGTTRTAAILPDASALITWSQRGLCRWPLTQTANKVEFGPPQSLGVAGSTNIEWGGLSHDGRWFAAGDRDRGRVTLVNLTTGDIVRTIEEKNPSRVVLDGTGRHLAMSTWNSMKNQVRCFDVTTGERLLEIASENTAPIALSNDGTRLLVGGAGSLALFDCKSAASNWLRRPLHSQVHEVCWSPATNLVAADCGPTTISLIDPDRSHVVATFPGTRPKAFSRDGMKLLTMTPEVWDLRAVRRVLADMGIDWQGPAFEDSAPQPFQPLVVEIRPDH